MLLISSLTLPADHSDLSLKLSTSGARVGTHTMKAIQGFTLIELMVTMAVFAVLLLIAAPNLHDVLARNAVSAESNQLLSLLKTARSEAVSAHHPTALCGSSDASACGAGGVTTDLSGGVMVWSDSAISGAPSFGAGDTVLFAGAARSNLTAILVAPPGFGNQIGFNQQGEVIGANGAEIDILVCAKRHTADASGASTTTAPGAEVVVSASGRSLIRPLAAGAACSVSPT